MTLPTRTTVWRETRRLLSFALGLFVFAAMLDNLRSAPRAQRIIPAVVCLGQVLCVCFGVRGGTTLEPLGWAGHTLGVVLLIIGGMH
jgi:peptidoglycan/LPS O-acetylase OafA/YrhL